MKYQNFLILLAFLIITSPGLCNVEISTEPTEVFFQQAYQKGGVVHFTVTSNDFNSATPEDPVTVRMHFSHSVVHQYSQVGWPGYDPEMKLDPVFLPMELINAPVGSQLVAPPDTVAIVRWLETENKIWFQVNHSSNTWIRNPQGELVPPSLENGFVRFSLGHSPQVSHAHYFPHFRAKLGNLPGATRDLNFLNDPHNANLCVSPEFVINFSTRRYPSPPPFPVPDLECESIFGFICFRLVFTIISFVDTRYDGTFGVFTADIGVGIDKGNDLVTSFRGDSILSVGRIANTDIIFPWVTNNTQYQSEIVINNLEDHMVDVYLKAHRPAGNDPASDLRMEPFSIGPLEQWKGTPGDLFPDLGQGAGFMVRLISSSEHIHAAYVVRAGSSPAQANVVPAAQASEIQLFNYLPITENVFSAPVVVNLGSELAEVTYHAFQLGEEVAVTHREIPSGRPHAELTRSLFPEIFGDLFVVIQSSQPVVGSAFIFNDRGEPSMANSTPLELFFPLTP